MQSLSSVDIEPARMSQGNLCSGDIIPLGVEPPKRDGRAIMPPVFASKIFYECERFLVRSSLPAKFGFVTDQFPNVGMRGTRLIQNGESGAVIPSSVPNAREIDSCDPWSGKFFAHPFVGIEGRAEKLLRLGRLALMQQDGTKIDPGRWVVRGRLQNATQYFFGRIVVSAAHIHLS